MVVEDNDYSQDKTVHVGRASVEDIRVSRSRLFVVSGLFIAVFIALAFRVVEVSVTGVIWSGYRSVRIYVFFA